MRLELRIGKRFVNKDWMKCCLPQSRVGKNDYFSNTNVNLKACVRVFSMESRRNLERVSSLSMMTIFLANHSCQEGLSENTAPAMQPVLESRPIIIRWDQRNFEKEK
jgi:hypothetical protein